MNIPLGNFGGKWQWISEQEDPLLADLLRQREIAAHQSQETVRRISESKAFVPTPFKPQGLFVAEFESLVMQDARDQEEEKFINGR